MLIAAIWHCGDWVLQHVSWRPPETRDAIANRIALNRAQEIGALGLGDLTSLARFGSGPEQTMATEALGAEI